LTFQTKSCKYIDTAWLIGILKNIFLKFIKLNYFLDFLIICYIIVARLLLTKHNITMGVFINSGMEQGKNTMSKKEVSMFKGKFLKPFTFSIMLSGFLAATSFAQLANSPWPMLGQNAKHTGIGISDTPTSSTVQWEYKLDFPAYSSAVLGIGGSIYFGSWDNYLIALTSEGTFQWKYLTGDHVETTPAVGADGTIYFGSWDKYFYALNSDGILKWKYLTGNLIRSSPAIGADGTIYFGADENLYALNPDGTLKWKFLTGIIVRSSPVIGTDGTIYITSSTYDVFAINPSGSLKWNYKSNWVLDATIAIGPDGTLYFAADKNLNALNPDGTLKWKFPVLAGAASFPSIGHDGTIYLGSEDHNLYAVTSDGTLKWKAQAEDSASGSLAIGFDGTVYFGSYDNYLYAINSDGNQKWKVKAPFDFNNSPAFGQNGTLYIGVGDKFYAFAPEKFILSVNENPVSFKVYEPYPNPFNPTTTISYTLPGPGYVSLNVYNISGQKTASLVNGFVSAGKHDITFDGSGLSSGIYFYRFETAKLSKTGRMMLLK
jgi:outer membrane protein assembly factor BamB